MALGIRHTVFSIQCSAKAFAARCSKPTVKHTGPITSGERVFGKGLKICISSLSTGKEQRLSRYGQAIAATCKLLLSADKKKQKHDD